VGWEIGLVYNDERLHAVKITLRGASAACGAGLIATRVPGHFQPDAEDACPDCAGSLTAPA